MLRKNGSEFMFNFIAPIYSLFYGMQKKKFTQAISAARGTVDLTQYDTLLDVGCGTGALCSVLSSKGLAVTGVDTAEKMLSIAEKKSEKSVANFVSADVLKSLPFDDNAFDISIASYVAHGMQPDERKKMYAEMSRVTKSKVIIYDYNKKRGLKTTVIEWLEKGDYFNFIQSAASEMRECFSAVEVLNVSARAAWYICTPF